MIENKLRRSILLAVFVWAGASPALAAWTGTASEANAPPERSMTRMAQGGCSAAASQAAAQTGGQVLSVQTAQRGGRTVCIVTVLVPGRDGSRPRRQTITIPQ